MVSKSMVQTFSYPASEAEMIEEATKMAKADGVSFSEFLVSLVREEVRKKVVGAENPIRVNYDIYGIKPNKHCQTDLTQWFSHVDQTTEQKELNKIKGQALEIIRRTDKRSMELRMEGFRR